MVMYSSLTIICVLLSIVAERTHAAGNYVILAPQYLRDKQPYQLSVTTLGFDGFSKLHLAIEGTTNSDEEINIEKDVRLQRNQAELVVLDTTTLPPGSYSLRLLSESGGEIDTTIPLTVLDKAYVVLVQMDKPIYRPGNTVKFRVLVLDQTTKPLKKLKAIKVMLSDPNEIPIKVWPHAMLRNGVFQSELEISNEPNLGNWSITANVSGTLYPFSFEVNEYKAPKYELTITTPNVVSVRDKSLMIDIEAWYTFGKPIKGDVTIKVSGPKTISKMSKINGSLRMTFGMSDLVELPYDLNGDTVVNVNVSVHDQYTKKTLTASNSLMIYKNSHQITLRKSSKHFIPGHLHRCWLRIRDPSGAALVDNAEIQASIVISYAGENNLNQTVELHMTPESDGNIPLTLTIPEQATLAEIDVTYHKSNERFLLKSNELSGPEQIQLSVLTEQVVLNRPLRVQVQSSVHLNQLTYQVLSKGKILLVKNLVIDGSKSVILDIDVTPDMIPSAKIFVFSLWSNKILKDTVTVQVNSLTNWVNVSLPVDEIEPGKRIRLTAESQPKSIIGLLAVDRSTWLLGDGNQITRQKVLDELKSFSDEIEGAADSIDEMAIMTNAVIPTAVSARFGDYEPDEEDAYIPPRREFPESWLWFDLNETGSDGKLNISDKVPASITSWQIMAFSLSPEHGLGVLEHPVTLNVFKPFFMIINLPNSIKKSETAVIEVTIFNYLDQMAYVGVKLKNSRQEYEFVNNQGRKDASYQAKNVILAANSASTVKFIIKPRKMGNILIKVIAESTDASDSVERLLRVTPESLPHHKTISRFIELDNSSKYFRIELEIPKHIDENSENISLSVQGNVLGDAANGLEGLIQMPSGSGEQNALKMVPNVVLLDYMSSTGEYDEVLKKRAARFLNMGYQNELKYKHNDGSFSMFGKEDDTGSVFLTALVAKTFQQMSRFITVNQEVIYTAYDWLQQRQSSNGKFSEIGTVPEYGLQQLHKDDTILTAYTLIAFLEDKSIAEKYKSVINKGTQYLSSKVMDLDSVYAQSLTVYALHLSQHKSKEEAFRKLVERSKSDHSRHTRWWDAGSMSIETTAYALMTYINRGNYVDSKSMLNWLISKRKFLGPDNIQTTFVGLQAIAEHSKKITPLRNDYDVIVEYAPHQIASINVDPQTSLELQNLTLPSSVRMLEVTIQGTGTGTFSIDYSYNSNILNLKPRFKVQVQTLNTSTSHYLDLQICARFIPSESYEQTALVLMEIIFPSGYIALDDSVEELEAMQTIKKVVTKYEDESLLLYFESLPETYQCLPVSGFRQSDVLQQIPGSVRVFDFYDNSRIAIAHFDSKQLGVCDICDDDCPADCEK